MTPGSAIRTVLELDLVAYSDTAHDLHDQLDVYAVKALQDQVQSFVDVGLTALNLARNDVVFGTAGDNALILFPDGETAHRFADVVHAACAAHNRDKRESAARWFRMGGATGEVLVIREQRRLVSNRIIVAVRLEQAARRGELVIDASTFALLPDELKARYSDEEVIAGKRAEKFAARRCGFVPGLSPLPTPSADPVGDLYDRLEERFHADYVTPTQIAAVRRFASKQIGVELAPVESILAWMRVNPRSFQVLSETVPGDDGPVTKVAGFFSLRPLTAEAVGLLEVGAIDGATLLPEHTLPHDCPLATAVYVGGLAARDRQARAALILTIKGEVRHFRDRGVKLFFTRPLTEDGLRLATRNGFLPVTAGKPADKGVYRLEFPT